MLDDPRGLVAGGFVGVMPVKNAEVGHRAHAPVAEIEFAIESPAKRLEWCANVSGTSKRSDQPVVIIRRVAKFAGFQQCGHQSEMFFGGFLGEITTYHENLFWMTRIEFRTGGDTRASASLNCDGVPGFTRAEAIEMTGLEICHHLGRWHDNDVDIAVRMNARGGEPAAEKEIMR